MSFAIRPTRPDEAGLLPAVERSAGQAFRAYPDLAWLADGDDLPAEHHALRIAQGLSWVAVDRADAPFAFLIAERHDDALHIEELDVRQDRQGKGVGRALLRHIVAWAREQGLGDDNTHDFPRGRLERALLCARGLPDGRRRGAQHAAQGSARVGARPWPHARRP